MKECTKINRMGSTRIFELFQDEFELSTEQINNLTLEEVTLLLEFAWRR